MALIIIILVLLAIIAVATLAIVILMVVGQRWKLLWKHITFADLLRFNLDLLDDDAINDAISIINGKYEEKGASGSVAKSSTFINDIDEVLNL